MSGFFKKLFNRITGRGEDAPAPVEQAALPPPEDTPVAEDVVAEDVAIPALEEVVTPPPVPVIPEAPVEKAAPAPKSAPKPAAKAKEPPPPPVKRPAPVKTPAKTVTPPVKAKAGKAPAVKAAPLAKAEPEKPVTRKQVAAPAPAAKPKAKAAPPPHAERLSPTPQPVAPPPPEIPPPAPPPIPVPVTEPITPPPPPLPPVPEPVPTPPSPPAPPELRSGFFSRLKSGLSKSSKSLTGSITAIFTKRKLDADTLQDLEDTLIQADLGVTVAERIIKAVSHGRYDKEIDPEEVKQILASEVSKVLKPVEVPFNFGAEKPFVILVVGVNGSGKTTTIGKLGAIAAREGFKVKFAACDTFRAAAIEQLTVWGKRIGAETVSRPPGSDAAGLAFDAMKAAREDGTDIVFIDTAGRLHNKTYLMDELDKVVRVIKKYDAAPPHAVLLVLDATTGQNALAQADAFTKVAGVTGLIMTKLDGTARGGILVAIAERFRLPIHAIGVGESIDDLQPFEADAFSRAIAGLNEK